MPMRSLTADEIRWVQSRLTGNLGLLLVGVGTVELYLRFGVEFSITAEDDGASRIDFKQHHHAGAGVAWCPVPAPADSA
jgi:hypothetical protein